MVAYLRLTLVAMFAVQCMAFPLSISSNSTSFSPLLTLSNLLPSSLLSLDMQEMADLAMNPELDTQSLIHLYQESADIINGTQADSVLFQLNPMSNQTNVTNPILVMAVLNPNGPSQQDLLHRFRMYFVNMTDLPNSEQVNTAINQLLARTRQNMWTVFRNFIKNQANAIIGALWLPFNVGSKAMQQTSEEHAQYVEAGTTFGSTISQPIIMKAISLPNSIATTVVNMTTSKANAVKMAETYSKQASSSAVDAISSGTHTSSQLAVQYLARPVGAFIGSNLNIAGNTLASIGERVDHAGVQLALLGQRLGLGATDAVSHGATAIAWSLDNNVILPGEQPVASN